MLSIRPELRLHYKFWMTNVTHMFFKGVRPCGLQRTGTICYEMLTPYYKLAKARNHQNAKAAALLTQNFQIRSVLGVQNWM